MRTPRPFKPNGERPPPRSTARSSARPVAPLRVAPLRLIEQALQDLRAGPADGNHASSLHTGPISMLLVNLDRFKLVNDLCGHLAGDILIHVVHERCSRFLPASQVIHLGADEFALLLPDRAAQAAAEQIAGQLLKAIAEPVSRGRHIVHPTASIGIATDLLGEDPGAELLRGASIALSQAKEAGGDCARSFVPEMLAHLVDRAALEEDLRGGLQRGELVPHYQPIVALPSREIVRFEALARWDHARQGLLGPDCFLPLAEDVGLDDELLYTMFRQACRDACGWDEGIGLSLNLAPRQVCDPGIATRLLRIVFASGIRPSRITVEITENASVEDVEAAQATLAALREAGIGVALDDFGAGYASLARICALPLDMIKIDRTLVQSLDSDAGCKLVKVVADLGRSLGMPVTAEGIETAEQALRLHELGCAFGQGYLFGRPASAADTAVLLARGNPL
ncbi:bifunctional diguanylate cyclase/phosphodiesterase [Novosphingobium sp.]|uniref:putative bifunctional diguanylate cyclase/phosphodiesterase n=1 Tax=Novosphingobium sp. TaxID=1874826 RepID=UPI0028A66894|nr:bifunctional diguanylate cyclase/phosphodiesterase [Novosphingobium sp.]